MKTGQQHSGTGDNVVYKIVIDGKEVRVTIPRLLNLVPQSVEGAIIGRDTEVETAHEKLKTGAPVMLVNGIGGIGKTTVALKYIAEYEFHYQHIAWITVSGSLPEAFVIDRELAHSLDLEQTLASLPPEQLHEAGCKTILHRLSNLSGCLLIIDNANDLADLLQWQTTLGSCRAHVLITSRNEPQGWPCVHIETLPPDQARALFRQHYRFQSPQDAELDALLNDLGFHTLLLELAAKSAQASRIAFAELSERIRAGFIHDDELNKRAVDTGQSGKSVEDRKKIAKIEAYIDLIFNEISHLFDGEKEHLSTFTLLPPAEWYAEEELAGVFQLLYPESEFNADTLDRLTEKGWLQREEDPTRLLAYKIHPLIQDVAVSRLGITADRVGAVIRSVGERIHYSATDPGHNLFEKIKNKPPADYLEKRFRNARTEQIAYLLDRIAHLEENFGQYKVAASIGEKAYEITLEVLGPEHPTVAVSQSNLANVYRNLGQYEKARDLLEAALASAEKNFGPEHPTVAVSQSNLANVYRNLGQYEKARDLLEAALASDLKNFGPEHPTVAVSQSNLANVYSDLGQYEKARDLLEAALASAEKNFGPEHPNVAVSQSNLANVYSDLGQYEKARDLLEAALASAEKNFGPEHPNVAVRQSNLANVYSDLGQYEKARDLLEAALASAEKNFGPEHPTVAVSQSNLANVYRNLGQYEKARDLLEAALASAEKNFGPEHPTVAVSQSNLANVYRNLGQYEKARDLLEAALASAEKNFGPEHPNVAVRQINLGAVFSATGDKAKAKDLFRQAYALRKKLFGEDHPHTLRAKKWLDGG